MSLADHLRKSFSEDESEKWLPSSKKSCEHVFEFVRESYDGSDDLYRCALCGKEFWQEID